MVSTKRSHSIKHVTFTFLHYFIKNIERTSHEDIKEKQNHIRKIAKEAKEYIEKNEKLSEELETLNSQLLGLSDVTKSLRTLGNLRAKIQQKADTSDTE